MPYRTRPYIPFLPLIPNPFKVYSIEDGRLSVKTLGQVSHEVPLPPSSVTKPSGIAQFLMHKVLDRGDLVVRDAGGGAYRLDRVMGVSAFRAAITDETKIAAPKEPPGPPWYEGLQTEDHVVVIPICPDEFEGWLYTTRNGGGFTSEGNFAGLKHDVLVKEGDWVKKGQEVLLAAGSKVLSPVDGRVAAVGYGAHTWRWCCTTNWTEKQYADSYRLAIHPVRGRRAEGLDYSFGPLIERVRAALKSPGFIKEVSHKVRFTEQSQKDQFVREAEQALDEIVASMRAAGVRVRGIRNGDLVTD